MFSYSWNNFRAISIYFPYTLTRMIDCNMLLKKNKFHLLTDPFTLYRRLGFIEEIIYKITINIKKCDFDNFKTNYLYYIVTN